MDKKILLIGNTAGLPGVKVDIEGYKQFFKSAYGGNWNNVEIIEKIDMSKSALEVELAFLTLLSLDYLIVIFSGHGGQERETLLELNSSGETIGESELINLASRQLNIYDCCRAYPQQLVKGITSQLNERFFSVSNTRARYEQRIMQAIPQQVSLYACAKGECSYDTSQGGAYTIHLLRAASNIDSGEFKLVGTAHEEAAGPTTLRHPNQHPEAILPKCLSSQQLILSIKP